MLVHQRVTSKNQVPTFQVDQVAAILRTAPATYSSASDLAGMMITCVVVESTTIVYKP